MPRVVPIVENYTWVVPCTVTRRKDGDTFVVVAMIPGTIDIPMLNLHADMNFPQELVVRLEGVDAYEKKAPGGPEAIAFVDEWLRIYEGQLHLATNQKKDNFGRTLGDIRLSPSYLTGLANDLLQNGHATRFSLSLHGAW
jgi:endonuclease YncB( thermonuclease family)